MLFLGRCCVFGRMSVLFLGCWLVWVGFSWLWVCFLMVYGECFPCCWLVLGEFGLSVSGCSWWLVDGLVWSGLGVSLGGFWWALCWRFGVKFLVGRWWARVVLAGLGWTFWLCFVTLVVFGGFLCGFGWVWVQIFVLVVCGGRLVVLGGFPVVWGWVFGGSGWFGILGVGFLVDGLPFGAAWGTHRWFVVGILVIRA